MHLSFFWIAFIVFLVLLLASRSAKNRAVREGTAPGVIVETVKSDRQARDRIRFMLENGYTLQGTASSGILNRKTTLTFVKTQT